MLVFLVVVPPVGMYFRKGDRKCFWLYCSNIMMMNNAVIAKQMQPER